MTERRDLLSFLDAVVRAERGPAGLSGTIAFGIAYPEGQRWWTARFGKHVSTAFSRAKPDDYDVAVGLDEPGAESILGLPIEGRPMQLVSGDRQLLRRFTKRYLRKGSMLDVRAGVK